MTKPDFQKVVKSVFKNAAFKHLIDLQNIHTKNKYVNYTSLKMQSYLYDQTMSQDDINLLFAMRTKP